MKGQQLCAMIDGMVEAPVDTAKIKKTYDSYSKIYFLAAPFEKYARMRGLELAQIKSHDRVLEVAVGIGRTFLEFLKRMDPNNVVYGIDLSPKMLQKTKTFVSAKGYSNFDLRQGDARNLPFPDEHFDALYNSYMLDLIPISDFPVVLREFHRVLKPGGRLILVNLSKKTGTPVMYERLYKLAPYLLGGCRPVLMESHAIQSGFREVKREFLNTLLPSEVVTALK